MAKVDEVDLSKLTISDLWAALQYMEKPIAVWGDHPKDPSSDMGRRHLAKRNEVLDIAVQLETELKKRIGLE